MFDKVVKKSLTIHKTNAIEKQMFCWRKQTQMGERPLGDTLFLSPPRPQNRVKLKKTESQTKSKNPQNRIFRFGFDFVFRNPSEG